MRLFTIGHSTLEPQDFISTLNFFGIEKLVDVRSYPGSRYVPHFNKEVLPSLLGQANIEYAHFAALGGRRKSGNPKDYDLVCGWKNESFKNYASYTMTSEYEQGIAALLAEISAKTVCIMCAESVPWRCHRLLISNTLASRGVQMIHIIAKNQTVQHRLNLYGPLCKVQGGKVIYPKIEKAD